MAKKSVTITMKIGRNGSITLKSKGGIDLRKVVPQFFQLGENHDEVGAAVPTNLDGGDGL